MQKIKDYLFLKLNLPAVHAMRVKDPHVSWLRPEGILKFEVGKSYLPHTLIVNPSGELTVELQNNKFILKDKTALLLAENEPFQIKYKKNHTSDILLLYFGDDSLRCNEERLTVPYMFNKPFSNEFTFVSNSEKFISSFDIYRYDKLYLDSLHQFFACRLWQIKSDTESEINKLDFKKKSTREEVYCRLCRSLEYMEDLYDKNISLDELSKHSNISKYHYIRSFKKLFKTTPYGYLTNLRVLKAKVLLQTTELSISEISFNLGYENHSHFSLNFKKSTGFSPYQFRKSQKKSNIL